MKKNLRLFIHFEHFVYTGWMYFFDKYFNFFKYTTNKFQSYGKFVQLKAKRTISRKTNFIDFFETQDFKKIDKNDIIIVGDIFTNTLSYFFKGKNVIYYSEYFAYGKSFLNRLIFGIIGNLFFRNKKIIVPTKLGQKTYFKISKNVFYLPQLFIGDISPNQKTDYQNINILYVGRICSFPKKTDFLIDNYLKLKQDFPNINLTIIGQETENGFITKYQEFIDSGDLKYIPYIEHSKLDKIYSNTDIFVLPSYVDPIGAVVLEAMAKGCAVLVSDTCGAQGYVQNGINGFVFQNSDSQDFIQKLKKLVANTSNLDKMKTSSFRIVNQKHNGRNPKLMQNYYEKLMKFASK